MRAASSGVLDRALDVAAALEVRGYGAVRTPPRRRRPLTRHDIAFGAAAIAVLGLAIAARAASLTSFQAYPALHVSTDAATFTVAVALAALALAPFLDRRGVVR